MPRTTPAIRFFCASVTLLWALPSLAAELPSADEVLRIHRANQERLSQLHLQLVHVFETTAAHGRQAKKDVDQQQKLKEFLAAAKAKPDEIEIEVDGKKLRGLAALEMLEEALGGSENNALADAPSPASKPFSKSEPMEFFLSGENYQYRSPAKSLATDDQLKAWRFPDSALTTDTMSAEYSEVRIFSRSARSKPAARWWSPPTMQVSTDKHMGELMNVNLPPFTVITQPDWGGRHPIDAFFSGPADDYRVVRQEELDGRLLTVVEVGVPFNTNLPPDPQANLLAYRAWLDLERGALPLKVEHTQVSHQMLKDTERPWQPSEITVTQRVVELPGGAFYPAVTVQEHWQIDPDAPELTEEQWDEVRAGRRKAPLVVHWRNRWDCSLVETKTDFGQDFFVIPFSDQKQTFDYDADPKADRKPQVEVGQQAPPLTIAHWLDGKQRTLEELKGQVVVLNFWALWCSGCRAEVPELNTLAKHFQDKPVAFIAIHGPEKDQEDLARRIAEFQKKNEWNWIAAIDAGTEEKSTTGDDYGVVGLPLLVVIDRQGKIVYVDFMSDDDGPEVEDKLEETLEHHFKAVGEKWPPASGLSEKEQRELIHRVVWRFITQQIETALAAKP